VRAVIGAGALAALLLANFLTGTGTAVGQTDVVTEPDDAMVRRGAAVFQSTCAACHGTVAQGRSGTGVTAAPSLDDVPVAYVDLVLRTGVMPIAYPDLGVREEQLGDTDREAVVAWMRQRFALPGTIPQPGAGSAAGGLEPFVRHCAACHGVGGVGGVAGGGTFVPAIRGLDPVTIAEAARVGPFAMPAFSEEVLDDRAVEDIAAYLAHAEQGPRTLLGMREVDQVGTAVAGAVLVGALVLLLRVVAPRGQREDRP
jgi:ubiquinol-cytochrome c reductase cytochrome c subunit